MTTIKYTIKFSSYWAIGSGMGQGRGKDKVLLKGDDDILPFIPGRTLKGLLRDAAVECDAKTNIINKLFGKATDRTDDNDDTGLLDFDNAYLPKEERDYLIANKKYIKGLYDTRTATSLDEGKQTRKVSLRKIEVCIPVTLEAGIDSDEVLNQSEISTIEEAFKMLRLLGEKRYRGMGRCIVTTKTDANGNN